MFVGVCPLRVCSRDILAARGFCKYLLKVYQVLLLLLPIETIFKLLILMQVV